MKTNPEEMNLVEASPDVPVASIEAVGEQSGVKDQLDTQITGTETLQKQKKSFWASKISRLFGGEDVGYGEKEQQKSSSPSFLSKIKNVLNKGVDSAVKWSADVASEKKAFDVTRAANFLTETIPSKAAKFTEWSHKFATTGEDFPELNRAKEKVKLVEENHDVEMAVTEADTLKTPEALDNAKVAVAVRAERILGYGDKSTTFARRQGNSAERRKNNRLNKIKTGKIKSGNTQAIVANKSKQLEQFDIAA